MKHVPAPGQTRTNYRKQADEIMSSLSAQGVRKRLLLHVCCAPCSSACLELLTVYFDVTVLFYNPNITEEDEYRRRLEEEKRLIGAFNEKIARAHCRRGKDGGQAAGRAEGQHGAKRDTQ